MITGEKINFLISGGIHPIGDSAGATAVVLEIDGEMALKSTGNNSESMERAEWDVSGFKGQLAVIKIIDENPGGWGHINCDDFNMVDAAGNERPFTATGTSVNRRGKLATSWGAMKKMR